MQVFCVTNLVYLVFDLDSRRNNFHIILRTLICLDNFVLFNTKKRMLHIFAMVLSRHQLIFIVYQPKIGVNSFFPPVRDEQ